MSDRKVSNEELGEKLNLILEHLKFHDKRLEHLESGQERLETAIEEVRADIAELKNTRLTWSAGVLAGMATLSSIITLIVLRLLGSFGIKIAALNEVFV